MRVSTNMLYDLGVGTINQQYADLMKLQQQLATGRRILTPAEDPIAAARTLEVSQSKSANEQYILNGDSAKSALELQESVLSSVTSLLQDARVLAINAGDPALSNADRNSLADDLQGRYDQLLGLANSTDGNGQYLFSGYKGSTTPFTQSGPGAVSYNGDQGQRLVQISASRQVGISTSGAEAFQLIKNGNGTFATSAASTNTGSGVVSPGVVTDPAKWNAATNPKNFKIVFAVDSTVTPSSTTYDIVDATTITSLNPNGNSVLTGLQSNPSSPYPRTFTSGAAISLSQTSAPVFDYGAEITISGQPADGDSFTLEASKSNQDIFSTLSSLITALRAGVPGGPAGNTRLTNDLNTALQNIDLAQDNILSVRATVGASLREVEAVRTTGEDMDIQYSATLSELQDLDYAKAISDMAQKQANLQAAQKSFLNIQGLSLFNYIN